MEYTGEWSAQGTVEETIARNQCFWILPHDLNSLTLPGWCVCSGTVAHKGSVALELRSIQLSHPLKTSGKTIALILQTFASKVEMSMLFSILSKFLIAFLPRTKCLFCSVFLFVCLFFPLLQSLSAVILEPREINSVTAFIVSPCICHEIMELDAVIFVF